jgi:hypothetical protein
VITRRPPPTHTHTPQEEEARLREGTTKYAAFMVLKTCGPEGMTPNDIGDEAVKRGFKDDWGANGRRHLREVRSGRLCWFVIVVGAGGT